MFWREDVTMRLFQGCFFIIRPVFSLKRGWFIIRRHWFGSFLSCTWVILFIQKFLQRVIWGRRRQGIRRNFDIFSCCMDTFLFICVFHCGFCSLLIFRTLFILIHTSIHLSLFLLFLCFFLWFTNLFVFSPSFLLKLKIFLSFLIPPHFIIMTQYVLQSFRSLVYHAKISRILWMLIFVRLIYKSQFTIGVLKSSSVEDSFKPRTR